jgi:hypothetical protein
LPFARNRAGLERIARRSTIEPVCVEQNLQRFGSIAIVIYNQYATMIGHRRPERPPQNHVFALIAFARVVHEHSRGLANSAQSLSERNI